MEPDKTTTAQPLPGIDRPFIEQHYKNRSRTFHAVGDAFLQEAPKSVVRMQAALEQNDFALIADQAHTLKGSATLFGAKELTATALDIERAAAAEDKASVVQHIERIRTQVETVCNSLSSIKASMQ